MENLAMFWSIINRTFYSYMFRMFLNPVMVFLSLLGALPVVLEGKQAEVYLASWLPASGLPFALGSTVVQTRILYNLPMAVFAAYGLHALSSLVIKQTGSRKGRILCFLLVLLPVLASLNYVLGLLFDLSRVSFPRNFVN